MLLLVSVAVILTPTVCSTHTLAREPLPAAAASEISAPPWVTVTLPPLSTVPDAEIVVTPDRVPTFVTPAFELSMPCVVDDCFTVRVPSTFAFPPTVASKLTSSAPVMLVFAVTANPCPAFRSSVLPLLLLPMLLLSLLGLVVDRDTPPAAVTRRVFPPAARSVSPVTFAPPDTTVNVSPSEVVLDVASVVTPETAPAFVMLKPLLSIPWVVDPCPTTSVSVRLVPKVVTWSWPPASEDVSDVVSVPTTDAIPVIVVEASVDASLTCSVPLILVRPSTRTASA